MCIRDSSYTERIAKALEEKEQIPYRKDRMQGEIEEIMEQKGNRNPASGEEIKKPEAAGRQKKVTLIGEPVTMESLAAGIEQKYGCPVEVLCPLEKTEGDVYKRQDHSTAGKFLPGNGLWKAGGNDFSRRGNCCL